MFIQGGLQRGGGGKGDVGILLVSSAERIKRKNLKFYEPVEPLLKRNNILFAELFTSKSIFPEELRIMQVNCPLCAFPGNLDENRIPAQPVNITCPKCKKMFPISKDSTKTSLKSGSNHTTNDSLALPQKVPDEAAAVNRHIEKENETTNTLSPITPHHPSQPAIAESRADKFERKVLFSVVRWFSLSMGILGVIVLAFGVLKLSKSWNFFSSEHTVKVNQEEISEAVKRKNKPWEPVLKLVAKEEKPKELTANEKRITDLIDESIKIINGSFSDGSDPSIDREKFIKLINDNTSDMKELTIIKYLEGLKEVVANAPRGEKIDYIDRYMVIYREKYNDEKQR